MAEGRHWDAALGIRQASSSKQISTRKACRKPHTETVKMKTVKEGEDEEEESLDQSPHGHVALRGHNLPECSV